MLERFTDEDRNTLRAMLGESVAGKLSNLMDAACQAHGERSHWEDPAEDLPPAAESGPAPVTDTGSDTGSE